MLYETLKDFQSGIVGILGFVGVGFTLWWNARLARVGRDAVALRERETIQVALGEELRLLEKELAQIVAFLESSAVTINFAPFIQTEIYNTLIGKIGVLQADQVRTLIHAHASVRSTRHFITTHHEVDPSGYVKVKQIEFSRTKFYAQLTLETIREALSHFPSETS